MADLKYFDGTEWISLKGSDGQNGGDGTPPVQAGGRLTLDIGEPVAMEDMIASTLHYVPYIGDTFSVYDSSSSLWVARKCPALSLDISSLTANTVHDIFLSYVSDNWVLSAVAWADDRTRAVDLQRVDGIATNGANVSQRLIGTIKTNGTSQIEYTNDNRCVWNAYNQVQSVVQTRWYKTIAYDTPTWIPYGGSTTNGESRVSFVVGIPTPVQMTSNITQRFLYTGVVLDDLSEPWNNGQYTGTPGLNGNTTGGYITTPAIQSRVSPAGYNFVQACVFGFNSSSGAEDMLVQGVYMA